jgi:hypothetical protein
MPRNPHSGDYAVANRPDEFNRLSTSNPTTERWSRLNSTPIK